MAVVLEVTRRVRVRFPARHFRKLSRRVLTEIRPDLLSQSPILSLVWVSDAEIKRINGIYRGKPKPTDVLSFSFLNGKRLGSDNMLGELMISLETLKRQARQAGHTMATEADVLFVHGLLHILGFDHERPADLKKMLACERRFLGDKAGLISRSLAVSKMGSH